MKKTCLILAAWLMNAGVFGVSLAATVPDEIESRTLDNGLKIIVWPDHDIPNVVMYNFVHPRTRPANSTVSWKLRELRIMPTLPAM